jgi:hypothetical protein
MFDIFDALRENGVNVDKYVNRASCEKETEELDIYDVMEQNKVVEEKAKKLFNKKIEVIEVIKTTKEVSEGYIPPMEKADETLDLSLVGKDIIVNTKYYKRQGTILRIENGFYIVSCGLAGDLRLSREDFLV